MKNNSAGDVIKYLYDEMTVTEAKSFSKKLEQDQALREEYESLRQSMKHLETVKKLSPGDKVLSNILKYARSVKAVEQQ